MDVLDRKEERSNWAYQQMVPWETGGSTPESLISNILDKSSQEYTATPILGE
jgi:hypothetical protein